MGGTKHRMEQLVKHLKNEVFKTEQGSNDDFQDLCENGQRFAVFKVQCVLKYSTIIFSLILFKVGPVLCISHGIGMSSMSVLLHELLKLAKYAKCVDPIFIRIGTSGGLGVDPGTVVVTKEAYNGYLRNEHEIVRLRKYITLILLNKFLRQSWENV